MSPLLPPSLLSLHVILCVYWNYWIKWIKWQDYLFHYVKQYLWCWCIFLIWIANPKQKYKLIGWNIWLLDINVAYVILWLSFTYNSYKKNYKHARTKLFINDYCTMNKEFRIRWAMHAEAIAAPSHKWLTLPEYSSIWLMEKWNWN